MGTNCNSKKPKRVMTLKEKVELLYRIQLSLSHQRINCALYPEERRAGRGLCYNKKKG